MKERVREFSLYLRKAKKMKATAVIIDDERKSVAILQNKLARFCPQVQVIGSTESPQQGLELIEKLQPDVVFLDVAMPVMSGFDLLARIEDPDFELVFVTAFDDFAIEAIRHCAIGYLVKPVDNDDLIATVKNVLINRGKKTGLAKNKLLVQNNNTHSFTDRNIAIPIREGFEFIKLEDIVRLEGEDGYTRIHRKKGNSILSSYNVP